MRRAVTTTRSIPHADAREFYAAVRSYDGVPMMDDDAHYFGHETSMMSIIAAKVHILQFARSRRRG